MRMGTACANLTRTENGRQIILRTFRKNSANWVASPCVHPHALSQPASPLALGMTEVQLSQVESSKPQMVRSFVRLAGRS